MVPSKTTCLSVLLCLGALVFLVAPGDAAVVKGVNVQGVSPDWAHTTGGTRIEVFGCGFRTYETVTCMWNWRWKSSTAAIISDEVIVCETPEIPKGEFDTLPLATRMDLVFDGDRNADNKALLATNNFRFGPSLISFNPPAGFVGGGDFFEVSGQGFDEFTSAVILFDSTPCVVDPEISLFEGSGKLRCRTPPGEFGQDAVITVTFDNNPVWTVHARSTYHYGPVLTGVRPSCTPANGGTRVTIYGDRLLDPMITEEALPRDAPVVTLVVANTRYFGEHVLRNRDGTIEFTTPVLPTNVAWGAQPEIYVFFKRVHSKVAVAPSSLRYGGFVYTTNNPSPAVGHAGGHDTLTIRGCGFFNLTQVEVGVFVDGTEICDRGLGRGHNTTDTLRIIADGENTEDDHIICTTVPRTCNQVGSNSHNLDVRFTPARFAPAVFTSPTLAYEIGPSPNSTEPSRGARLGGNTVAIRGSGFYRTGNSTAQNPGWQALVRFVSSNFNTTVTVPPALGTIVSDNLITLKAPIGRFGLDTHIEVDFGTGTAASFVVSSFCNAIPRTTRHSYHYGPQCTAVEPAVGHLSGGDSVTLHGTGFTEDNIQREDVEVRFCLDRLNSTTCKSWEVHERDGSFIVEEDRIIVKVPHIRQSVKTMVGGNRLFGDTATVTVHVRHPGGGFFPITALSPDLNGDAKFTCGQYRFGPMVTSITPREGTNGPRAPLSPGLPITVTGMAFDDPWYQNNYTVALGNLEQYRLDSDPANTDTQLHQRTIWGATANTDVPVTVTFNPCNTTISKEWVLYGPNITKVTGPNTPMTEGADLWGLKPWGGEEITLSGVGFSEFLKFGVYYARCIIGDEPVVSDYNSFTNTLTCTTRATYFGREAMVGIEFGTQCDDLTKPVDHRNVNYAQQKVFFRPRIDRISPEDGPASGGSLVTLHGEGFLGWLKYECFFGGYTAGTLDLSTGPVQSKSVVCRTPTHRAEFNSNVTVALQLAADLFFHENGTFLNVNTTSGNFTAFNATGFPLTVSSTNLTLAMNSLNVSDEDHHMRVFAPATYHFGPVCTQIEQLTCSTQNGCADFNVLGRNFRDCVRSDGPTVPINDCVWHRYQIEFVGSNGQITVLNAATNNTFLFSNSDTRLTAVAPGTTEGCGFRPQVQIRALDALVMNPANAVIQCYPPRDFDVHYGPLATGVSSTHHDALTQTSYGWQSDLVTVVGRNFFDISSFVGGGTFGGNIRCKFGDAEETIPSSSNDNVIFCPAPTGTLGTTVDVTVEYVGGPQPCTGPRALPGGKFHFGPVIRDIAPGYGYVQGNTEITIFGVGFACCGIQRAECLFPDGPVAANIFNTNQVRCRTPINNISGRRINNVGIRFHGSFGTYDVTLAENGQALSHFYGPVVTSITPHFVDLSGRDQVVTINGEGFSDPFFPQTYCDYISQDGQMDIISDDRIELKFISDKQIRCIVPTFKRNCGGIDKVRPRWRNLDVVNNPRFFFLTEQPANLTVDAPPSFANGGSNTPTFATPNLHWGPTIKSLSRTHAPLEGDAEFVVTASNLRDFYSATPTNDFGRGEVLCAIGNRRSLASVQMVPAIVDQNGLNDTVIRCRSPPGPMGYRAKFALIINPNQDAKTTLVASTDNWHWLPHATTLSRRWGDASGREQVVVYGGGFCRYSTVQCLFGDAEGLHGEITNDYTVTCETPQRFASGNAVTLRFGRDQCVGAPTKRMVRPRDVVVASQGFTFVGATDLSPHQGPVCGETKIAVTGFGFTFFDQAFCVFARQQTNQVETRAIILNDNRVECESADVNQEDEEDGVFCQRVLLRLVRNDVSRFVEVPRSFEYGHPEVFDIHPKTADIDDLPITVTVRGIYFNGGNLGEKFKCRFGNIETDAVLIPGDQDDDENDSDSQIVCNTPTEAQGLIIGKYPVEIVYPCGVAGNRKIVRTNNRIPFTVTQRPNVLAYAPRTGPEIGGTEISILGDDFNGGTLYLCSFGNARTGDTIVVSARYKPGTARPANSVPSLPSIEDDDDNDDNGNRRKRSVAMTEATQGLEDAIVCKAPFNSVSGNTRVDLAISIDGGDNFYNARDRFIYTDILFYDDGDRCSRTEVSGGAETISRKEFTLLATIVVVVVSLLAFVM